jgi:hypothetical protein
VFKEPHLSTGFQGVCDSASARGWSGIEQSTEADATASKILSSKGRLRAAACRISMVAWAVEACGRARSIMLAVVGSGDLGGSGVMWEVAPGAAANFEDGALEISDEPIEE